jgi:hypothetical protein
MVICNKDIEHLAESKWLIKRKEKKEKRKKDTYSLIKGK